MIFKFTSTETRTKFLMYDLFRSCVFCNFATLKTFGITKFFFISFLMDSIISTCARLRTKFFTNNIYCPFNLHIFATLQTKFCSTLLLIKLFVHRFMFRVIFAKIKIFDSIVVNYAINMMRIFGGFKMTLKMFLKNKPVFKNITFGITKWMIRFKNENISFSVFIFSTLPVKILFSFGRFISKIRRATFKRTIFSYFKIFFTMRGKLDKYCPTSFASFLSCHKHILSHNHTFVKNRLLILLGILLITANAYALDWDLLDEDCVDISDWADLDNGSGASTQVTFDSKSCFKFDVPNGVGDDAIRRFTTTGTGLSFTFEFSVYFATHTGTWGGIYIQLRDNLNAAGEPYSYKSRLSTTTARIRDDSNSYYADIDLEKSVWHTVRFVVVNRVMSLWLDDRLYLHDITQDYIETGFTPNEVFFVLYGDDGAKTTYIDWARMDSSAEQISTSPLIIHDEKIVTRYRQHTDNADYPNGQEKLRTYGNTKVDANAEVLSIPLVATGDTNASKVRIYNGANTKSLMKLPE